MDLYEFVSRIESCVPAPPKTSYSDQIRNTALAYDGFTDYFSSLFRDLSDTPEGDYILHSILHFGVQQLVRRSYFSRGKDCYLQVGYRSPLDIYAACRGVYGVYLKSFFLPRFPVQALMSKQIAQPYFAKQEATNISSFEVLEVDTDLGDHLKERVGLVTLFLSDTAPSLETDIHRVIPLLNRHATIIVASQGSSGEEMEAIAHQCGLPHTLSRTIGNLTFALLRTRVMDYE